MKVDTLQHNNTLTTALMAMMFFAAVFRGPSLPGELREWFIVFFEISLAMVLSAFIWKHNKWIAMFLILAWVFTFFPKYNQHTYQASRNVFNGCLWYLFIVSVFSVQTLNKIYKTMRIIAYFHVVVIFFQRLGVAGWIQPYLLEGTLSPRPVGLMGNPLEAAALVGFLFPAFISLPKNRLFLAAIPAIGMIMIEQFLGFAALAAGVIFYVAVAYRLYWQTIIPTVILAAIWWFYWDAPGIGLRLYVWKKAVWAWGQHPFLAGGLGHWKIVFWRPMKHDGFIWDTTHNEFLQMLFELGALSAVVFIGYFVEFFKSLKKEVIISATSIIIIAIHCAASFPMHIATTAMIAMTWLAVFDIQRKEAK